MTQAATRAILDTADELAARDEEPQLPQVAEAGEIVAARWVQAARDNVNRPRSRSWPESTGEWNLART